MIHVTPRELARRLETAARLPAGRGDRFAGYGVLGLPFASGDILAFRRFATSSVGPAYTSVWHRDPAGRWALYTDTLPEAACPRYFGAALARADHAEIELTWTGPRSLALSVLEHKLDWAVRLEPTMTTRALNLAFALLPAPLVGRRLARPLGRVAGRLLHAGPMVFAGRTPNGHAFGFRPTHVWMATAAAAVADGREMGPVGSQGRNAALGGFVIPDRGVFAAGSWVFSGATTEPGHDPDGAGRAVPAAG